MEMMEKNDEYLMETSSFRQTDDNLRDTRLAQRTLPPMRRRHRAPTCWCSCSYS